MIRILVSVVFLAAAGTVAAAAGWYFLVREDAELATEAPDIPESVSGVSGTPTDGAAASPGPTTDDAATGTLTYRVIPELSEAAYFADEELANVGLPSTAKGATNDIEGTFYLTADGTALDTTAGDSIFTVDLRSLTSDESRRDNRVQEALETDRYPTATFVITGVSGYDPAVPEGSEQDLTMTGLLTLHGVTKEVTWDVQARREGNGISALATVNFLYSDFGITPPNIAGFVSVEDDVTLQVQIVAELS